MASKISVRYFEQRANQLTCVYGTVSHVLEFDDSKIYDVFPAGTPITFFVAYSEEQAEAIVPNAPGLLTNAIAGDCIVVLGYPYVSADPGETPNQLIAVDIRDLSQIVSELGMSSPTVEEITTQCQ